MAWSSRFATGTEATLAAEQRAREAANRAQEKQAASRVVKRFCERHEWPETDVYEIHAALGIPLKVENDQGTTTGREPDPEPPTVPVSRGPLVDPLRVRHGLGRQ